jgi:hypothetical protein
MFFGDGIAGLESLGGGVGVGGGFGMLIVRPGSRESPSWNCIVSIGPPLNNLPWTFLIASEAIIKLDVEGY